MVSRLPSPTQEWLPTTFTRHSELLNNFLLFTKPNSQSLFCVIAIGLLAPRPYLIVQLLRHQRGLPYWSTLVWNSHQLIPNKAYSPTGASIAEAIRRYFWLRLSLHFCPSRPPVRERPANLTIYGSTYCRLSSTKLLFGLLAPSGRIRISARWYSFFTELQTYQGSWQSLVEIALTRAIRRRVSVRSASRLNKSFKLERVEVAKYDFNLLCEPYIFIISKIFLKVKW